jgi:hypothetical protein
VSDDLPVPSSTVNMLDDIYQKFIEWKCKKITKDDPKDVAEFCAKHSITVEDVNDFVSKPTFADDIVNGSMGWARSKTPQMLHMLYDNVLTTKSSSDIRAFVELTNELKKKKDEKSNQFNQINFFNIDDQKFKAIAERYSGSGAIREISSN